MGRVDGWEGLTEWRVDAVEGGRRGKVDGLERLEES